MKLLKTGWLKGEKGPGGGTPGQVTSGTKENNESYPCKDQSSEEK